MAWATRRAGRSTRAGNHPPMGSHDSAAGPTAEADLAPFLDRYRRKTLDALGG